MRNLTLFSANDLAQADLLNLIDATVCRPADDRHFPEPYDADVLERKETGMADTVTLANPELGRVGAPATGFAFKRVASKDMLASIADALRTDEETSRRREMQLRAMQRETGWANSARRDVGLYEVLVGNTALRRFADRDGTKER